MKKTLIINLKRFGDIFQTAHLISTIKDKQPNHEVHILCYEESKRAAKVVRGISKIHTINRKKLISFFKNSIYSDGLALNELDLAIKNVTDMSFDRVINYSNDKVSTYISSFIASKSPEATLVGVSFNSRQSINYSSPYAITLNDVLTQTRFTPFNYNDTYHKLVGENYSCAPAEKVRSNNIHDNTARNNLNRLRANKSHDPSSVSVIGVQISASSALKEIPHETLVSTIEFINDNPTMVPILLLAPTSEERAIANRINGHFDNKLVSVEADFIALPSVLKNIDLLLTPDTAIKHLADLTNTPVLEVSLGFAPFFKQGTINPNSLIVSLPADQRNFSESSINKETAVAENSKLTANYLYEVLQAILDRDSSEAFNNPSEFCTYRPVRVVDGVFHMPLSGAFNYEYEAKRFLARAIMQKSNGGVIDENLIEQLYKRIDRKFIQKAIESEKTALSMLTKELLSTLRGLIQTQENKRKAPVFIEALEKLLSRCFENNLAAIHALQFRAKIESLNSSSMEDNFKEVEGLLYELKDALQGTMFVYKTCEEIGYAIKRGDRKVDLNEKTV